MKILLVEDTTSIGQLYQQYFTMVGEELRWVNDVDAVRDGAIEFRPDVILLDLMMPKKDGLAVLAELKSNPETADIPVIVLTNVTMETTEARADQLGAVDYVIKSDIELHALLELCHSVAG